jgi:uncharacterized protein YeaO (DUF488 family)
MMSADGGKVRVRRVYDDPDDDDGNRVLVDALWPRGLRTDAAHFDEWRKDVAPSPRLRTWYGHDPDRFDEFARRYRVELDDSDRAAALAHLRELAAHGTLTLLSATKAIDISQAAVLADVIRG